MTSTLSDINTASDLLRRVNAESILTLLQRLGFWVGEADQEVRSKQFNRNVSNLTSNQLGDEAAYWQSELSRAIEIVGALRARRHEADATLKRARARALKAETDRIAEGAKVPTKDVLAARVAEVPDVVDAEDAMVSLNTAIETLDAVVTAYEGYTRVLSREISRRGDQMRARL